MGASLALFSGCAKEDWIDRTLVTVDVTGTWATANRSVVLKLAQEGPMVTGSMVALGTMFGGGVSGAIEGTVSGEIFRFKQTSGTIWLKESEMTVSGDEMSGRMNNGIATLRRVDSSRPSSQ